jgi:hypothetical protein
MRESAFDLNHLLCLHQIALIQADGALNEEARHGHLTIARTYEDEIMRRTEGRLCLGRTHVRHFLEDTRAPIRKPMLLPA